MTPTPDQPASAGSGAEPAIQQPGREGGANAAVVTKRRDGRGYYGPRWRVVIDGKDSPFFIEKSVPPKYRHPQLWDVIEGEDAESVLFDSTGLDGALRVIETIVLAALSKARGENNFDPGSPAERA